MAGHSHSANIAIRKGKQDRIRANIFAKLSKNIMVAARKGPDPDSNFGLRHAIELARAQSMPKDKIDHAIKKGAGLIEGVKIDGDHLRGLRPGGVAIIVEALSDNLNRTRPEVARIFESSGGKLAAANSVLWMFKRRGVITVKTSLIPEEQLMELVLEAGADDLNTFGDTYEILTGIESFEAVRKALAAKEHRGRKRGNALPAGQSRRGGPGHGEEDPGAGGKAGRTRRCQRRASFHEDDR